MNRWMVYEYMKYRYIRTGEVPTANEVHGEFSGLSLGEIREGMAEFNLVIQRMEPGVTIRYECTTKNRAARQAQEG